jgi:hypothetical protein
MTKAPLKKTTLYLPETLRYRLKLRAVHQSTTTTRLIIQAVEQLLRTKPDADAPEPKPTRPSSPKGATR